MWMPRGLLLLGLLSGCAEARIDPHADDDDDDAPRVKPRLVTVEVPRVVHRQHVLDENGRLRWGDPELIDEAEVCVIERRDAFALFQPFETLDPPICVTAAAGKASQLTGIEADSELSISVRKSGYLSTLLSLRVASNDLLTPADSFLFLTPLLDESQAELFTRPSDGGSSNPTAGGVARIGIAPTLSGILPHDPYPEGQTLLHHGSVDLLPVSDAWVSLAALDTDDPWTLEVDAEPVLLEVSAGSYRARLDQPRMFCEPEGYLYRYTLYGLSTDTPEEVELRALPGHVSFAGFICLCVPPSPTAQLVDPYACSFAEPDL